MAKRHLSAKRVTRQCPKRRLPFAKLETRGADPKPPASGHPIVANALVGGEMLGWG